ncbi:MAG: zinc-ribbon domain-containing protein, partial [Promethearchaeota archaeon]
VDNRYEAALTNQRIKIREVTGGVGNDLADAAFSDSDKYGKWNKLEFRLDGTRFRFLINDAEYLTGTDGTHTSGYIGLRNYKDEPEDIAYFDVVYVRKYTEPEPQHGSWDSQLPQDGGQDLTVIIAVAGIGAFTAIGIAAFLKARSPRPEVAVPEPRRPLSEPTHEEERAPEEITPEREEAEEPGRLLPSDVLCSHCGHVNPAGAKYCIRCGRYMK